MAGLLTTIGIFALFFFFVIRPLQKRQMKYEKKYGIKSDNWQPNASQRDFSDTMPTSYNPSFSDLPGNVFHPEN